MEKEGRRNMNLPRPSVIILAWNGLPYLVPCLDAVLAQEVHGVEVLVVDNDSADGSASLVERQYPQVRLIRNERNLGFAGGNNVGLQHATGDVLVLLNQDTVVRPGWLAALLATFERCPDAGIVGSKILDPDACTLQHAGGRVERPLILGQHDGHGQPDNGQYDEPRQVEFITGASMALRRQLLAEIGPLDEGFYPGYFEDVDICHRARAAGYTVWYEPRSVLIHQESASMRCDSLAGHYFYYRSRIRFVLKHSAPAEIVDGFVPAEIARLADAPLEELRASALGAIEGLTIWPVIARRREPPLTQAEYRAVLGALRRLLDGLVRLEQLATAPAGELPSGATGAPLWAPAGEARQWLGSQPYSHYRRALELLDRSGQVTPRPFTSRAPIVGPLIVAFRTFVNNLATRWYVQPLLDQQAAFNANVTQLLAQTSLLPEHHSGFLAEQVADLHWHVLELQGRIAQLEEELERRTGHTSD
jgi:GT2 family glycosyltransferase